MGRLERLFFAVGFALLVTWGAALLHGIVFSRAAIAKFETDNTAQCGTSDPLAHEVAARSKAGLASWSIKPVQGYKDNLLDKVDTPLAILRIPNIHLEVPVFNGTDELTLNRGVGRIVGTAQVGAGGNLGIAGHRDGYFRGLKNVKQGDVIQLVRAGKIDFYVIDRVQVTQPDDVSVLKPTQEATLTLVTCFPFKYIGSAPKRYIVRASFWSVGQSKEGAGKGPNSMGNKSNKQGQ